MEENKCILILFKFFLLICFIYCIHPTLSILLILFFYQSYLQNELSRLHRIIIFLFLHAIPMTQNLCLYVYHYPCHDPFLVGLLNCTLQQLLLILSLHIFCNDYHLQVNFQAEDSGETNYMYQYSSIQRKMFCRNLHLINDGSVIHVL